MIQKSKIEKISFQRERSNVKSTSKTRETKKEDKKKKHSETPLERYSADGPEVQAEWDYNEEAGVPQTSDKAWVSREKIVSLTLP